MGRELTEAELDMVANKMDNLDFLGKDDDELDLEQLDHVRGDLPRDLAIKNALEHSELYREAAVDRLVEEQIRREEMMTSDEPSMGKSR